MSEQSQFTGVGILLIVMGLLLVAIPYVSRVINIEKIPWWVIYVYRSDGFTFATSPLLILLSVASIIFQYIRR